MRQTPQPVPRPNRQEAGNRLILSYEISSWVIVRLYGAAFLALSYATIAGPADLTRALRLAAFDPDPMLVPALFAWIGTLLFVPFFTPRVLRRPRRVGGGLAKAIILVVLALPIYLGTLDFLEAGALRFGSEIVGILPNLIKAVVGLAVTGSILVSLAQHLSSERDAPQAPVDAKLSAHQLRKIRKQRMLG